MPWNDNSKPGPWGSPPPGGGAGGPTGGDDGGGSGGPGRPRGDGPKGRRSPPGGSKPDLERLLRGWAQQIGDFFRGPGGLRPQAFGAAIGALAAVWILSGVFVVQPDQAGVITTFGAYSRTEGPGLRYHLPGPIEAVEKVPVTALQRIVIGDANVPDAAGAAAPSDSLMLTGDENIVDLDFSVSWRVADAGAYLFNLREPDQAVRDVAESSMREVVGRTPLQAILTTGRGDVQTRVAELMQKTLDGYNAGVTVVEVQIQAAKPPADVVQAFRDVANAGQEAESAVNDAKTYSNRVVNEAKGDASKIVQSAQGYREQAVREAEGDASRFNQIYEQYRKAPAVTRERLYLETMERVLAKSNKVIVDGKGTSAPIILPPDVFRPRQGAAAPALPPVQAPAAPSAAPAVSSDQGAP
jgi:membrane protease subunit HflK